MSAAALRRLEGLHPRAIAMGLERVERLLRTLDSPQVLLPSVVHATGTNGKGSTLRMLRAALEAEGCRVNVYSSPHLVSFHERICLAGADIGEPQLAALLAEVEAANGGEPITFFEATTCAALLACSRSPADFTLIEVGMGGRTDATNVSGLPVSVCIFTPISLDHQAFLGDTVEAIAREKAGILRPGAVGVVGPQPPAALKVIREVAQAVGCRLHVFGEHWTVREEAGELVYKESGSEEIRLPLPQLVGPHQVTNAGVAIAALHELRRQGGSTPTRPSLEAAVASADWPARMQRITSGPLADAHPQAELWLDGGHNPAAGEALAETLRRLEPLETHLVCGMLRTKDVHRYLMPLQPRTRSLQAVDIHGASQPALEAAEVEAVAREVGIAAETSASPLEAVRALCERTSNSRCRVVICGSLALAGQVLREYSDASSQRIDGATTGGGVAAFIGLGSNLGDRAAHISGAVNELRALGHVSRLSALYCTEPQLYADQPDFLNAAVELRTELSPSELLCRLKAIERRLGRVPAAVRYGPRVIDLDLLLYSDAVVEVETPEGTLNVPHQRVLERSFVLKPLCDLDPGLSHPSWQVNVSEALAKLRETCPHDRPPCRVLPIRPDVVWELGERTRVMGILNVTPDSFSDGGFHSEVDAAVRAARAMVRAGCDVIDVGAESTRPGAERISQEEELSRLLPVLRAIRQSGGSAPPDGGCDEDAEWGRKVVISVDTTRAAVAAAAVKAGADLINDISAGAFDGAMMSTVAELGVPMIMMHTRGTPRVMRDLAEYKDVTREVCAELTVQVDAALSAGLPPWLLLVDPGIGFAKTPQHSLELLRELPSLVSHFCAEGSFRATGVLVGASRKGFIGATLNEPDPLKRHWGNAATVTAAIVGGADIVRVHEVPEMTQVARMSDAIYRKGYFEARSRL